MSRTKRKAPKEDINFTIEDVEYSLTPLTQRVAANVFHNCLVRVVASITKAASGATSAEKMDKLAEAISSQLKFDDVWFILSKMMAHALVDDDEVGDLDTSKVFDENPHHMYLVLYYGIKGNWPKVFSKLETKMGGFVSRAMKIIKGMGEIEPDETEETED